MEGVGEYLWLLGSALAIGLLIGVERGWQARQAAEGQRIAGLRTYGLFGLLGGGAALLGRSLGGTVLGLLFLGFAITVTATYLLQRRRGGDVGITSLVAALLTFVLGAMVALGHTGPAAAAAVVTVLLLGFKETLHGWLRRLEQEELHAALQLLLISVVVLPVLPDRGYGPWGALNPYQIWWMVVLIAAISFSGYMAVKIAGTEKGILLTGLFAGLASSTAVTLHLSRMARRETGLEHLLAAGILVACGTMYPRMVLLAAVVNPPLLPTLLPPLAAMAVVTYGGALLFWWRSSTDTGHPVTSLRNPLELRVALLFGLLLATVMLLGEALRNQFGAAGLYGLAAVSGLADVDAMTLTLARMTETGLAAATAMTGMVVAAASNSVVKSALTVMVGGRALALRVAPVLCLSALAGLGLAWVV